MSEADASQLDATLTQASTRLISAASILELTMVLSSRARDPKAAASDLLQDYAMTVEPVDLAQLNAAQDAFLAYGKGRHPAALNFGDCFSYALAKTRRAPLLFKGADFPQTDIRSALHSR